jgi:hypothetical protein
LMVTVNEQLAVTPPAPVATQLTVVTPIGNAEPLGGEQATLAGQFPDTDGITKLTTAEHALRSLNCVMATGQVIVGAGLLTIAFAVDTLLSGFVSGVEALKTVAVFPTTAPLGTKQATFAIMVIIALDPDGSVANVIVWLLPEPPHTPPPVEVQDTVLTFAENTSVTVTFVAAAGPALLTRMVLVIGDPAFTRAGDTLASTERSACVPPDTPPT